MNLEPVRQALLAQAQRDAEQLRSAATREAEAGVAAARQEAVRLIEAARAEGEAEAKAVAATELARARRHSREVVLAARNDAYRRARAEAEGAARDLRHDGGYPALVAALSELAAEQLGSGAEVRIDDDAGGLVATAGSRSVDYRLPVMASRCLRELGDEVEILWR